MEFIVEPAIFERFPGLRLSVAVAYGLDNGTARQEITTAWRAAWDAAAAHVAPYPNPQSHPHIVPWRERFKAMGISVKEFRSSAEALLRRAAKGGEPFTINPLVDFYNAISLRHVAPAGAFDLAELAGPLELRLSRQGDWFTPLENPDAGEPVPPGEVSYANGTTILTRHFVWRQSKTAAITPASRDVFLVAEVLAELGEQVAVAICDDFRSGLEHWFAVPCDTWIVDSAHPAIAWSPPPARAAP